MKELQESIVLKEEKPCHTSSLPGNTLVQFEDKYCHQHWNGWLMYSYQFDLNVVS
jgi:hypothetical protein